MKKISSAQRWPDETPPFYTKEYFINICRKKRSLPTAKCEVLCLSKEKKKEKNNTRLPVNSELSH